MNRTRNDDSVNNYSNQYHRRVAMNPQQQQRQRPRKQIPVVVTGILLLVIVLSWIAIMQIICMGVAKLEVVVGTVVSAFHIVQQYRSNHHEPLRHVQLSKRYQGSLSSLLFIRSSRYSSIDDGSLLGEIASNCDYASNHRRRRQLIYRRRIGTHIDATTNMDIVDAEFSPIDESQNDDDDDNNNNTVNISTQQQNSVTTAIRSDKSLLDMSFELDHEFMNSRIPFVDTTVATTTNVDNSIGNEATSTTMTKNNYIDVKLAFMVTLDNVQYGIGVPYDAAAAITCEQPDGTIEYVSPDVVTGGTSRSSDNDDDDMSELIAIMATQLQQYVGADVQLQHTPRVLTISGNIDQYTKDWESKLLPKAFNATQLLDTLTTTAEATEKKNDSGGDEEEDEDPELAFFYNLMREELGQAEYDKIMNDDNDDESEEMQELMKLFEGPFISDDDVGNNETMNELISTLLTPEQEYENAKKALDLLDPQQLQFSNSGATNSTNGYMALKLISYMFANGKSYSLVQLLQPYVIVGKYALSSTSSTDNDDEKDDIDDANSRNRGDDEMGYFELLLPEEEQIVIPRLETICSEDLQKANLQFQRNEKPVL